MQVRGSRSVKKTLRVKALTSPPVRIEMISRTEMG